MVGRILFLRVFKPNILKRTIESKHSNQTIPLFQTIPMHEVSIFVHKKGPTLFLYYWFIKS
ncbi:hypothetical protein HanRHA438_Chr03g0148141 [Helianthus annuus]|nr:hypothetical protein HanRHA438_Chr03g0148141 [Helianthus annuus]